ncbi:MAG: glycerophosphodiester phosphodiesterase [Candidatus Heimdallarchaeota archaeon]
MINLEIVAHRGVPQEKPENTISSFQRAIELGADAIELDIRLARDRVPIVYHYFYLDEATSGSGLISNYALAQLQDVKVLGNDRKPVKDARIPTLYWT